MLTPPSARSPTPVQSDRARATAVVLVLAGVWVVLVIGSRERTVEPSGPSEQSVPVAPLTATRDGPASPPPSSPPAPTVTRSTAPQATAASRTAAWGNAARPPETGRARTVEWVNLRAGPSRATTVLLIIPPQAAVVPDSLAAGWRRVRYGEVVGWVDERLLSTGIR